MDELLARVARGPTMRHVRYVRPVGPAAAQGLVAEVYRQVERDFGLLAPPVALHSAAPEALAACWLMLRETLLVAGLTRRSTREVVATAVSLANRCPYCVEVHSATLVGLARRVAVPPDRDPDPATQALTDWAGATPAGSAAGPPPASFPSGHTAELVGVAVTFHYLNRMVNVFLQESPLPAGLPSGVRAVARRVAGAC